MTLKMKAKRKDVLCMRMTSETLVILLVGTRPGANEQNAIEQRGEIIESTCVCSIKATKHVRW